MKKYQIFFSENLHFLVVKFSVHLNRRVFVMLRQMLYHVAVRWSRCLSYSLLLCGLFYEAICFMSYLVLFWFCVFSVLLALRLPHLGKRELVLVLFVRLFGLRLFGFVCFLFLFVSGRGCDLWLWHSLDFSLTFFLYCKAVHAK